MKNEEINDWSRKLLPVVVFAFLFLLIVYVWLVSIKYLPTIAQGFFPNLSPNGVKDYGEVGELYGAASSFFSGLAILLIIFLLWRQRTDSHLHQKEMQVLKSDFEVNRLNNLIIAQVNRIEYLVESLSFLDLDGEEYEGAYGIDFLNAALKVKDIEKYRSGEMAGKAEEELIVQNYKSIKRLLVTIAQSNQTIEDQVQISNIGEVERERLYAIYLRNMGASNLVFLRKLESFTDIIINSENTYQHKEMDFSNPIFILSELSAGFFHNIASNCQSNLVNRIIPEPI
ncbi:MAG: hypothetical protein R2788_03820 [Saprospiraceae bacterium]